jgi:hypothetical protein
VPLKTEFAGLQGILATIMRQVERTKYWWARATGRSPQAYPHGGPPAAPRVWLAARKVDLISRDNTLEAKFSALYDYAKLRAPAEREGLLAALPRGFLLSKKPAHAAKQGGGAGGGPA